MGSAGRVTVLSIAALLSAAAGRLGAADGASGLDREVVVAGEDRVVLRAPEPARWAAVELPDLGRDLPPAPPDPPLVPPIPPASAPAPAQVIALMEVPDA